jgi:hypothetical protein
MDDKFRRMYKKVVVTYAESLPHHLPRENEGSVTQFSLYSLSLDKI